MSKRKMIILVAASVAFVLIATLIPLIILFSSGAPNGKDGHDGGQTSCETDFESVVTDASVYENIETVTDTTTQSAADFEEEEEMRGIWIATVNNINFPSKKGLGMDVLSKELDSIVEFSVKNGFNTILFQVRPAADALYNSKLFPPSSVVSGECGVKADGDFDCLLYLLNKAHENGIKVYAWINPLRVTMGNATYPQTDLAVLPDSSPAKQHPEYVVAYNDGKLYFDAGIAEVRSLVADGIREICENYEVDGIIFDDYFYPYPKDGAEFDDFDTYEKYGGEYADIGDFRRDSINKLVQLCYETVKEIDSDISFGISPFGIWQNDRENNGGSMTRGLEAYSAIYCDALAWAKGGYVDYIAPQLYWNFDTAAAPFGTLAKWWSEALCDTGVDLYINHGAYRYTGGGMTSGEMEKQIEFSRGLECYSGGLYYGYAALFQNDGGVTDEIVKAFKING